MDKADRVVLTCFAVGQGLANLAEFYNGDTLIFLAIFDLGCFNSAGAKAPESIRYVFNKMKARCEAEQKTKGSVYKGGLFLDLLVISHQDEDHWQLLSQLLSSSAELFPNYKLISENVSSLFVRKSVPFYSDQIEISQIWRLSPKDVPCADFTQVIKTKNGIEFTCIDNENISYRFVDGWYIYGVNVRINIEVNKKSRSEKEMKPLIEQIKSISQMHNISGLNILGLLQSSRDRIYIVIDGNLTIKKSCRCSTTEISYTRSINISESGMSVCNLKEQGKYDHSKCAYQRELLVDNVTGFEADFLPVLPPEKLVDGKILEMKKFIDSVAEDRPKDSLIIHTTVAGGISPRFKKDKCELWYTAGT